MALPRQGACRKAASLTLYCVTQCTTSSTISLSNMACSGAVLLQQALVHRPPCSVRLW